MRSLKTSTLLKVGTSPTNITEEEKEKSTLREETKNGPKKFKVPVQKARVQGCHAEQKMTASQPHGETTNVTEQTSSRSPSSQKRRSSKQQQGRHPEECREGDAAELKFLQFPRVIRRRLRRAWRLRSRQPEPEVEVSSICGKCKGRRL